MPQTIAHATTAAISQPRAVVNIRLIKHGLGAVLNFSAEKDRLNFLLAQRDVRSATAVVQQNQSP